MKRRPTIAKAIIVDLDGTLSNSEHRKKYVDGSLGKKDWDKFYGGLSKDPINKWCAEMIISMDSIYNQWCENLRIIFVTGRPQKYMGETVSWLATHGFYCGEYLLFMRENDDFRQDYIIKKEIYEKHIKDYYEVLFCIDDRKQVVEMWRKQGLVCLHCAEGDF